ncbi:MAG: HAMP domain-containing histidine kinase [Oscillospiraceae bacterium]|nr:HAMP domain-containing histidine kinase [Oscillospiraceae bacterium]
MKKKRRIRFNLYFGLAAILMVVMALIVIIANLISQAFRVELSMYPMIFLSAATMLIAVVVAVFIAKWLFDPIAELGRALDRVAQGDYTIRVSTRSRFREVRSIYKNFNLMAKELEATEILQTDFISNVSHEFKTPINAIEGYATLLQDSSQTKEDAQGYAARILFNTQRLSELVGNILLLSRLDNQAIQNRRTTFRLDEQIRKAIILLEPKWSKKDIQFDVDMEELTCTGDESLLLHVWSNLIDNAVKFDPEGGLVAIRLTEGPEGLVFTIEDSGPGVPEEAQKHIFDQFYQTDNSHKMEGNGLGLALVKKILTLAGGTVGVENLPEHGCRFTVTLPKAGT